MGLGKKKELKFVYVTHRFDYSEKEFLEAKVAQEKIIRLLYQKVVLQDTGS